MKQPFTCVIVDDEPSAQQVLEQYISDSPSLKLKQTCNNAIEAMEYLATNSADILFLDINMPRLSGIDFLKSAENTPAVILTTAYDDYALKGYELDVIDYLLKPFSFDRFLQAIQKAEQRISSSAEAGIMNIKANGRIYRVPIDEIRVIESQGDYVTMHLDDMKLTYYESLKNLEEELPNDRFTRVHRSYIVQISSVEYLEGNTLLVGDLTIPVGGMYREKILDFFS